MLCRPPSPALAPFVSSLWATMGDRPPVSTRERALPNGEIHIAIRLKEVPVWIFEGLEDRDGQHHSTAVVGGLRERFHLRDTSTPAPVVGVQLRPGAARALLGVPAGELAGQHIALSALWGPAVEELRERLAGSATLAERLDLLDALLCRRVSAPPALHPAVVLAIHRFQRPSPAPVEAVRREAGLSHRHFVSLFRDQVGMAPKAWCRVLRFQRVLKGAAAPRPGGWAAIAQDCGYADQSHLIREFRAIAGIAPGAWAPLPGQPNHVPIRS